MGSLEVDEPADGVVRLTISNPAKRNALDREILDALASLLPGLDARCVVLTGAGSIFSAGYDIGDLAPERLAEEAAELVAHPFQAALEALDAVAPPVVAALNGHAIGGGLELALACDLRVLSEDAVVGLPETRLGLVPDLGGSSRLPQVVGLGRAKELIMTGRVIGAADAERYGLANRVAPAERLDAVTQELVDELLACAPIAVGLAKRLMDASARPALSTTLELEIAAQEQCARSDDVKEGVRAAAERRAPNFTGS
jgi:enoyl-CoA hydratase/carnithine racemase